MERQKGLRDRDWDWGEKQQTCDDRLLWLALKMRCPALWTDHDDDNTTYYMRVKGYSGTKVSRAPSKLAAVSNWKTSRRSCMCVCVTLRVCVCVCKGLCACVSVCRLVTWNQIRHHNFTLNRLGNWAAQPWAVPQIQSVSKRGFPKGFFPATGKITTTASALASSQPYRAAGATVQAARSTKNILIKTK